MCPSNSVYSNLSYSITITLLGYCNNSFLSYGVYSVKGSHFCSFCSVRPPTSMSLFNNSLELSPSWQANSRSASQEISRCLRNPKIQCLLPNNQPLDPILSRRNQIHILKHDFFHNRILGTTLTNILYNFKCVLLNTILSNFLYIISPFIAKYTKLNLF
jgi:hypothetical protein